MLAEQAVLGTILLDNEAIDEVSGILTPSDFFHPAHGVLFEAMLLLRARKEPIDILTMVAELRERQRLNTVGGVQYLGELTDTIATTAHVATHAAIVARESLARQYAEMSQEGIALIAGGARVSDVAMKVQQNLGKFLAVVSNGFMRVDDIVLQAFEKLERTIENPTSTPGLTTGSRDFDKLTGGDMPYEVTILAGRPGMGKTSYVLEKILAAARAEYRRVAALVAPQDLRPERMKPVLFFSLEMDRISLIERLLCSMARVDSAKLRQGNLTQDDLNALTAAANELAGLPIYINDNGETTAVEMVGQVREFHRRYGGIVKVTIDYLQIVRSGLRFGNRQEEITYISKTLLLMTKCYGFPLDLVAQLNREATKGTDHRPQLAHLRESGSLEQDAHRVVFLHREEYYDPHTEDRGIAEIIVAKNRNGPTDTIRLRWINSITKFEDLAVDMDAADPYSPPPVKDDGEGLPMEDVPFFG
jgi:replicative DNA helicase